MADRPRVTIALRAPTSFEFKRADGSNGEGWNFVSVDGKQKFASFEPKLVDAFEKAKLEGVEHEYVIKPPPEGSRKAPTIVEIPGVFDKPRGSGGGGGRPAGPMLSDRQAALFAGVGLVGHGVDPALVGAAIAAADRFVSWLAGASKVEQAPVAGASRDESERVKPSEPRTPRGVPARPSKLRVLRSALHAAGVEESKVCAHYGVAMLEELNEQECEDALGVVRARLVEPSWEETPA